MPHSDTKVVLLTKRVKPIFKPFTAMNTAGIVPGQIAAQGQAAQPTISCSQFYCKYMQDFFLIFLFMYLLLVHKLFFKLFLT